MPARPPEGFDKINLMLEKIPKRAGCHILQQIITTHFLENCYDIRTVQEFFGYKDVSTTMIYTHVLNRGGKAARSPLEGL